MYTEEDGKKKKKHGIHIIYSGRKVQWATFLKSLSPSGPEHHQSHLNAWNVNGILMM